MYLKSQLFTDTFFNKNNEFQYFIYIDTNFVLVVNFRSDSDTHTTARHKGFYILCKIHQVDTMVIEDLWAVPKAFCCTLLSASASRPYISTRQGHRSYYAGPLTSSPLLVRRESRMVWHATQSCCEVTF